MNIKHLSAFLAVAEYCSFTKAASSLGLAQPTVTARIKSLEQALDTPLLHRTVGGTRLTPAGRRLHRYASRIVQLSEYAQQAVTETVEFRPSLTVGAAECLTAYRLVPLIEYMHLRHPGYDLSLRALDDDPVALVRDERMDCAFFIGKRVAEDDVHQLMLCTEQLALVAEPSHPLAAVQGVSLRGLSKQTVICASRGSGYQTAFEDALSQAEVETSGILSLGSIDAVKRGLSDGMGVALLPQISVEQELRTGKLRRIDWQAPFQVFAQCVWRRGLDDDAVFRALLSTALQVTAEQVAS